MIHISLQSDINNNAGTGGEQRQRCVTSGTINEVPRNILCVMRDSEQVHLECV